MKSKAKLWIAALTALLVGMPLAEKAVADDTEEIIYASISLIGAIIGAASEAS